MQKNSINSRFPLLLLALFSGLAALLLLVLTLQQPSGFRAEREESWPNESHLPPVSELSSAHKKAVVKIQATETEAPEVAAEERHGWPTVEEIYRFFKELNAQEVKAEEKVSRVRVFLKEQIVAVYGQKEGKDALLRVIPCSSGYYDGHTPLGQFRIGVKNLENVMFDGSIGRYSCQISGNILFHSITSYNGNSYSGLQVSDINAMGIPASHGCVRLFAADAKWLFDRMPSGTTVEILAERGETFRSLPDHVHYLRLKEGAPTWDPSDPSPDNPYKDFETFKTWVMEKPWENYRFVAPEWPAAEPVYVEPEVLPQEFSGGESENATELPEESSSIPAATTASQFDPAHETFATVTVVETSAQYPFTPPKNNRHSDP